LKICDNFITNMKTIELEEFVSNFMEISNDLTHAELRMLYTLINDPDVINLSQQQFADKLGVNRRTIVIGLQKLEQHKYISDKNITLTSEQRAKEFILTEFNKFYYNPKNDKEIKVGQDFYHKMLSELKPPKHISYDRKLLTATIKENYPQCEFFWKRNKNV